MYNTYVINIFNVCTYVGKIYNISKMIYTINKSKKNDLETKNSIIIIVLYIRASEI